MNPIVDNWPSIKALGIKIPDETWDRLHEQYAAIWPDWVDENSLLEWFEIELALAALRAREAWGEGNCDNEQHIHICKGRAITVIRMDCGGCLAELKAKLEAEK